jgi:hypothetical protein
MIFLWHGGIRTAFCRWTFSFPWPESSSVGGAQVQPAYCYRLAEDLADKKGLPVVSLQEFVQTHKDAPDN